MTIYTGEQRALTSEALYCWGNFHKAVVYGWAWWPSYSYWIVPGTYNE